MSKQKPMVLIIAGVAVIAIVAIGGFLYLQKGNHVSPVSPQPTPPPQSGAQQKAEAISLGGQILDKVQNPSKDNLPETNPFKNLYKNPFK